MAMVPRAPKNGGALFFEGFYSEEIGKSIVHGYLVGVFITRESYSFEGYYPKP